VSTYTPLTSVSLTNSTTQSVTFSSIPQNYTDLVIAISGQAATTATSINLTFNSDTSSSYSMKYLSGNGSASAAGTTGSSTSAAVGALYTSGAGNTILNVQSYANTYAYKNVISFSTNTTAFASGRTSIWKNTSAITSIKLEVDVPTPYYASGTTFSLYGIDAGAVSGAKATGGNIVATDGTYWYHAFTASGVFTPTSNITADALVIAGGGGGGYGSNNGCGGGGGAGGLVWSTSNSLTSSTNYQILIGAGGAGFSTTTFNAVALNGINSVAFGKTAIGGGGGSTQASDNNQHASAGGSGGAGARGANGGADPGGATLQSASASGGYGNVGGNGFHNPGVSSNGGGGGGAGGAGASAPYGGSGAGAGGVGLTSTTVSALAGIGAATRLGQLSGGLYYFAGGGGGGSDTGATGAGGLGGGGVGVIANNPAVSSGAFATGGGGGAGAGNGGSGLVVVRYAV
jgi:hypothetical protein